MNKEFWDEIHKKAVLFRNKKRQQYLKGLLLPEEKLLIERWDYKSRDLNEEPLSIDVRLKKDGF